MTNPYIDFVLGVQSLRRRVERDVLALGGALGVAARVYPHQVHTVHRILTATRIRHLIADEVGLGKTIQAIMIVNALRLADPNHRTLILVPANLTAQWINEFVTRGHVMPTAQQPLQRPSDVTILTPVSITKPTQIDPDLYNLLIVDEFPRLPAAVRDRITSVAADFSQIVMLTATPGFSEPNLRRQIFSVLEPERAALAEFDSTDCVEALSEREKRESLVVEHAASSVKAQAALVHSAIRQVVQTTRADYAGLLPVRRHLNVVVLPSQGEYERNELMWKAIKLLVASNTTRDLGALARVTLRSPEALAKRLSSLHESGEVARYLEEAFASVRRTRGDAKLERLLELLAEVWKVKPQQQIVVVAEDNSTVDYLVTNIQRYLPELGPAGKRCSLVVAALRNRTDSEDDIAEEYQVLDEQVKSFNTGTAQILVAADAAQVGLNLQRARVLIFYSLPWRPQEIEQWIGRLDRLGSSAFEETEAKDRTIDVYTIVREGAVDDRIAQVLIASGVFARSNVIEGHSAESFAESIQAAALSDDVDLWRRATQQALALKVEFESEIPKGPLAKHLPYGAAIALKQYSRIVGSPPIQPLLQPVPSHWTGPNSWQTAVEQWLRLFARTKEYDIRRAKDPSDPAFRFMSFWYLRPQFTYGYATPRVPLPSISPENPRYRACFLTRREDVTLPPRRSVATTEDVFPLGFFDHGAPLHEDLVRAWTEVGKRGPAWLAVKFPDGHSLSRRLAGKKLAVAVFHTDPAPAAQLLQTLDPSLKQEGRTVPERETIRRAQRRAAEDLQADRRWLMELLPPKLLAVSLIESEAGWAALEPNLTQALFFPFSLEGTTYATWTQSRAIAPTDEMKSAGRRAIPVLVEARNKLLNEARMSWLSGLRSAVASRIRIIHAEGEDFVGLQEREVHRLQLMGYDRSTNSLQVTQFRAASLASELARSALTFRLREIGAISDRVPGIRLEPYRLLMLVVDPN